MSNICQPSYTSSAIDSTASPHPASCGVFQLHVNSLFTSMWATILSLNLFSQEPLNPTPTIVVYSGDDKPLNDEAEITIKMEDHAMIMDNKVLCISNCFRCFVLMF